jgi:DNA polymerase III epsilon subunit-like protein
MGDEFVFMDEIENNNFSAIIDQYNFDHNMGTADELKKKYKDIGKYINGYSKLKKDELIECARQINKYKNNRDKMLIKLDDEQGTIVYCTPYHHMRVIAGAGSGKTTTILYRVKHLVEKYVTPDRILILTFNVDACNNLKTRIKEIFGFDIKIEIKTIDSFSAQIFYTYKHLLEGYIGNISVNEYSTYALKIMKKCGKPISNKYCHIFFDEFQDISDVQFDLLKECANNGSFITVIGDDNQNIYQWRGSNNNFIINFDKIMDNTKTYQITTNYRSSESIVALANDSIKNNKNRVKKDMKALKQTTIKIRPTLYIFKDVNREFDFIMNQIKFLVETKNYTYDKFSILSRNAYYLKLFEEHIEKINKKNKKNKDKFIPYISLITDDLNDNKLAIKDNHITISTIHRSKGLEWQVVFMLGCSDSKFPCLMNNNFVNIEEERRLFYVGVTRAKTYLYFTCNTKELPMSRFIDEVYDHIRIVNRTDDKSYEERSNIFFKINDNYLRDKYSVTDTIKLLRNHDYEYLRENNYIPTTEVKKTKLYTNDLSFNKKIKEYNFESDFGEFCDRVITRLIMKDSTEKIHDPHVEQILTIIYLEKNEMEICNKYKLNMILKAHNYNKQQVIDYLREKIDKKESNDIVLINMILRKIPNGKNAEFVRQNTYPRKFLDKLKVANENFCNKKIENNDILRDIYEVSLCGKFYDSRRRLLYRDIYDMYMDGFQKINERMVDYSSKIKDKNNICKVVVNKMYNINENYVSLNGEIDLINVHDSSIVDFKCSESEFKMEWLLQLLFYYSLLNKEHYDINKLVIFNILKGELYEIEIDNTYPYLELLEYVKTVITRDIMGQRDIPKKKDKKIEKIKEEKEKELGDLFDSIGMSLLMVDNDKMIDKTPVNEEKIKLNNILNIHIQDNDINVDNYMFVDTETTGTSVIEADIVQLAYQIYDKNFKKIKEVIRNVIPERAIISEGAYKIHGIDHNKLLKTGEKFKDVFLDFLKDIQSVKYVIGHNVKFDINMIENCLKKYNFENNKPFTDKIIEDTGSIGKPICNLKDIRGNIKMPKLEEMYNILFNKKIVNAHNALADVDACAKCYFKIKGIIVQDMETSKINYKEILNLINKQYLRLEELLLYTDDQYDDIIDKYDNIKLKSNIVCKELYKKCN